MRVLVLNQYFHPDRSATSQLLTELCEDLAEHHEVHVVTGRPSYAPTERSRSRGLISHERLGPIRVHRVWSTAFDRASMTGRLTNYGTYLATSIVGAVRAAHPDVVVALTDPPPIGVIGAALAQRRKVPFVLVTKDVFPDVAIALGKLSEGQIARGARSLMSRLYRSADRIVSIGGDMTRRLQSIGVDPDRIATIHDWADGSVVRPLEGPSPLRAELGWQDRFVVMHSGNVGLSQSLDTLVDAAELLRDEADVLFAIVGDGASKARLQADVERRALPNVRFLPYQPKATLSESLGAADVHVVSLRRGLAGLIVPSKVYGILAAGRPFIAAVDAGSEAAWIARYHGCGLAVEPDAPEELAKAIVRARGLDLVALGRNARRAFNERYDRPLATAAYRSLMEEAARR